MKLGSYIFLIVMTASIVLTAKPVYFRDIIVDKSSATVNGKVTAQAEFSIPVDCKSFHLFDSKGAELPLTIMRVEGGKYIICFNARPEEKLRLEIYRDKKTNKIADPVTGLLLTVKKFNGSTVRNLNDFNRCWNKADFVGSKFVKKVYSGSNPFGPGTNYMFRYRGHIKLDRDGEWSFYTASTDASFLLVDGKLVCSWPGRHWVYHGQFGKYSGKMNLKAGLHKFEYLHANNQNACYAIAAFRYPRQKAKKLNIIPENMFSKSVNANAEWLHDNNGTKHEIADYKWNLVEMLNLGDIQMYCLNFTANKSGHFNFGDYTKPVKATADKAVTHYYFKPELYQVKLSNGKEETAQYLKFGYIYSQTMLSSKKAEKLIAAALDQERTTGIQVEGYNFLARAIFTFKLKQFADRFYKRLIEVQNSVPPEVVYSYFSRMMLETRLKKEQYDSALKELDKFIDKLKNPKLLSQAYLEKAEILFYGKGLITDAEKQLQKSDYNKLEKDNKKRWSLLNADLTLMKSGYDSALALYNKMDSITRKLDKRQKLLYSGVTINVRNCLVLKRYADALEYIEKLEAVKPEIRMNSEWMLLKGQTYANLGMPLRASVCNELVLKLNPSVSGFASANLALAEYYYNKKDYRRAMPYLRAVKSEAPRSRQAVAAGKLLEKISKN